MVTATEKTYDVVFVGWISQRRKNIVTELTKRGFKVLIMERKWGTSRDIDISKAKLLLNIHYHESYNIYEAIRCDRWIFAGMMVVSEDSIDTNLLDTKDLVEFEKYDNLVNKVIDVLHNYDEYQKKFISKHTELIENLKSQRNIGEEEFLDIIRI